MAKGTTPKSSRFHKWYRTNRKEFLVFLAAVVNMGLIKRSNLKDLSQSTPFFSEIFIRDYFFMLQSVLQ